MLDSVLFAVFRSVVFTMRFLPLPVWLAAARGLGEIYYLCDAKKRRRALWNLKVAFPEKTDKERRRILRAMYRNFGQNIIEMLYTPYMDPAYVRSHVEVKGKEVLDEALQAGRGALLLGTHAGSWELSNMMSALMTPAGSYAMLARPQKKTKKIDAFLNKLRQDKGVRVIRIQELKSMVGQLKSNKVLGAAADHGGKDGYAVPFFGKMTMTAPGSLRLAKKYGGAVILAFMHRLKDGHHEMIFRRFDPSPGDDEAGLKADLTRINAIYEEWIRLWPEEYLWFYRRWKYSPDKHVLVISDSKAGHVKQSLSLVDVLKDLGWSVRTSVVGVSFKNRFLRRCFTGITFIAGAAAARRLLFFFVSADTFRGLTTPAVDLVVSTGASLAGVNLAVAWGNEAKSICLMKPSVLSSRRFDVVVMPEHDRPVSRQNVIFIQGSLTSITPDIMKRDFEDLLRLRSELTGIGDQPSPKIGVLIGGDSRHYSMTLSMIEELSFQLDKFLKDTGGVLLVTTSRRTPPEVSEALRQKWSQDNRCRLLVIASEDNPAGTVGGILHAADIVIVSGESISMVSEAAASGKSILVFEPERLTQHNKIQLFLEKMQSDRAIYLVKTNEIYDKLSWIVRSRPRRESLKTRERLREDLQKLLG